MRLLDEDDVEGAAVVIDALRQTQDAFDSVAPTYDAWNAANSTLCGMRRRTIDAVTAYAPPGARLLDLGCGPGADAEFLARAGYHVTAVDWSPAMVDEARTRMASAALTHRVDVRHLGIHELDRLDGDRFPAAYSTLGPLNCVPNLRDAARLIARCLGPHGVLVASVIGRVCPWELALFASRGDWQRLRVRYAPDLTPVPLNGKTVWTRYYTPREFERPFEQAGFVRVSLRALGLFVPPPYMHAFTVRHPRLVARLQRLDDALGDRAGFRVWGDHFLIVMRKTT